MIKLQDPSLYPNYIEVFQIQKPFKLSNEVKSFDDTFMARLFKCSLNYKIQLTSENNVTFFYKCIVDQNVCAEISERNSLDISFTDFFDWTKQMLSNDYTYEFYINSKSEGELKILKKEKFKLYELATVPFTIAIEDQVRENLMYRYQRMKNRKQLLIDYWNKMTAIIKTKNPTLLLNLEADRKQKKSFK